MFTKKTSTGSRGGPVQGTHLTATVWSCGWAAAVFLCERRSDPPGLELGRLDIGTSLLKGHTLSRHYHSLKGEHSVTRTTHTQTHRNTNTHRISKKEPSIF